MSTASVADFVESLRKGRLLDAARIDKILKAQQRFPNAVTLAKELVRKGWLTREQAQELLQGKPTVAPPPTAPTPAPSAPPSRGRAWLLVLLILLLLGGAAGFGWWWYGNHSNDGHANASNRSTADQQGSPIGGCNDTSVLKTMDPLVFGEPVRAAFDPKFLDALKDKPIPEIERYKDWQPNGLVAVLGEHRMRNILFAANPDGTMLATGGNQDAFIRIGPVETLHEKIILPGHGAPLYALAWSPKGDWLASASADGTVRLWDVHNLEQIPPPNVLEKWHVHCLAFSGDGKYLVGGSAGAADQPNSGLVWLWDVEKRERPPVKHKTNSPVGSVAISPSPGDYRVLWGGGPDDAKLYLWDFNPELGADGKELARLDIRDPNKEVRKGDSQSFVGSVAFSPDGKRAVTAHNRRNFVENRGEWSVHFWDLDDFAEGHEKHTLAGFNDDPIPTFAPDGKTLVTARRTDNSVMLWDANDAKPIRAVATTGAIWTLRFLPRSDRQDDRVIFTSSFGVDQNIHIHEAATGKEIRPPIGHLAAVKSVAASPTGRHIASGGYEGHGRLWDLDTLDGPVLGGLGGDLWSCGFHPDGSKAFYCGRYTGQVPFLDVQTGKAASPPYTQAHRGGICNAVVSEDGHYLLTGGYDDGTVCLWELKDGKQVRSFAPPAAGPASVALSPTGKRALRSFGHYPPAVGDSLSLLHLRCQQPLKDWNGGTWNTYLADGNIAILGASGAAAVGKILDVSDDQSKDAGTLHINLVGASPGTITRDLSRLATILPDPSNLSGRLVVFDLKTHQPVWEWKPPLHFHGVSAVALSEDGRYLFTANGDGTVYVIQLP